MAYDTQSAFAGFRYSDARPNIDTTGILKGGQLLGEALKSGRQKELENARFALEQKAAKRTEDLFNRQTDEYNREVGLRDTRKDLTNEFLANPYASKFGSDKETALLDKQVMDYVNNGGEINLEQAAQLQARYEQARPFKEDAINTITANLIATGEDPLKASQTATVLGSNLLSRADMQAKADAQQQLQQKYYDEQMKATIEAAKLNTDISKTNAGIDKDLAIAKYKLLTGGGSSGAGGGSTISVGMPGGDPTKVQEAIVAMDLGPVDTGRAGDMLKTYMDKGYTPNQVLSAIKSGADFDIGGVASDRHINKDIVTKKLSEMNPGDTTFGAGGLNVQKASGNYTGEMLTPKFAQRQVVDYNPKQFLEGSLQSMPWLGGQDKPLLGESTNSAKDIIGSNIKSMVVDKYGEGNFNKEVYDKNLSKVESGGNYNAYNATSKAFGKYQFVPGTINSLLKEDGNKHTMEEVKKSPELQDYYYNKLTKENINTLKNSGVPVNNFTVYMAHNLGPSQTANFFSNEPLTEATKKAIQAQGVEPTREAYANRFMNKFEGLATPEERRPTVQTKDITKMTDAERKTYADSIFGTTESSPIKELFNGGKSSEIKKELDLLKNDKSPQAEDRKLLLNDQYQVAKENEDSAKNSKVYEEVKNKFIQNNGGLMDSNLAIMNIMKKTGVSRKEAENKYDSLVEEVKKSNVYKKSLLNTSDY